MEKHFIPFFAGSLSGIEENLVLLKNEIEANGLVDVKVCAIDNTWSGLKLVIPLKDRPPAK